MRLNGIHEMQFSGEAARKDGCHAFVGLDNNDELRRLASMGHKCWFRKWIGDAVLSSQQVIDNTPNLGEKEAWFADNPIGLILSNEGDTGTGKMTFAQRASWEKAAIKYGVQTRGMKRFAVGTFPMGTPDITNPQVCADLGAAYRDWLNAQAVDGVPAIIDLDLHDYVPDFTWLYKASAFVLYSPGLATLARYEVVRESRTTKVYRDGETPRPYETSHIESTPLSVADAVANGKAGMPVAARAIMPWDWYFTRGRFWFWPEYSIRLDSTRVKVVASERGADKMGTGGCKALGYTTAQVHDAMGRMLDLMNEPLVMDVATGTTAPSPFYAGCWFQMGDNVRWAGYNMADYVNAGLGADAYVRPVV